MRRLVLPLLLIGALLAPIMNAAAIEPESREAIVLHNRVFEGAAFVENFVPSDIDEVVLLADSENAFLYVRTFEYFWPLSREVYVAFSTLREELPGTLAIWRDGVPVAEIDSDLWAIVYPEGAHRGGARMLWGAQAEAAHRGFVQAMADYNRAFSEAQKDRSRYLAELKAAAEARVRGEAPPEVAPPIEPPEPVRETVTEPQPGFRVGLPAGTYEIALIESGTTVEGTTRRLRVVPTSAAAAVTADIIPEERWTRVLASNRPSDRIFVAEDTTIFVALNESSRFDDADYARLSRPQQAGVPGREHWVRRQPHGAERIEMRWDGGPWQPLFRGAYKAEQTGGRNLGYFIRPAGDGETPDVTAFAIRVPEWSAGRGELRLPPGDGRPAVSEWTREVVIVRASPPALVWGAAFVPALFGLGVALARRAGRK